MTIRENLDLDELYLYTRKGDYIPRIAAVHDLCGYGKCSLGVAIPVLSTAGCDVCPVPTGLFSSHTLFSTFYMHDTTEMLTDYLASWREIGIEIDAVYSGFLGAPEQVERIKELYAHYPGALRIVDPVMADNGKVYPTYTPELCSAMAELACGADLLTPNLTEAAIILEEEWHGCDIDDAEARRILEALLAKGAKTVVLKGIQRGDGLVRNFLGTSCEGDGETGGEVDSKADEKSGGEVDGEAEGESNGGAGKSDDNGLFRMAEVSNQYLPYTLHGTGDLYCSCLLAALMAGRSLYEAVAFAGEFVVEAMQITSKQPAFEERGVSFEPLLGKVAALIA